MERLQEQADKNYKILQDRFDQGLDRYRSGMGWPDMEGSELDAFKEHSLEDQANWFNVRTCYND